MKLSTVITTLDLIKKQYGEDIDVLIAIDDEWNAIGQPFFSIYKEGNKLIIHPENPQSF